MRLKDLFLEHHSEDRAELARQNDCDDRSIEIIQLNRQGLWRVDEKVISLKSISSRYS